MKTIKITLESGDDYYSKLDSLVSDFSEKENLYVVENNSNVLFYAQDKANNVYYDENFNPLELYRIDINSLDEEIKITQSEFFENNIKKIEEIKNYPLSKYLEILNKALKVNLNKGESSVVIISDVSSSMIFTHYLECLKVYFPFELSLSNSLIKILGLNINLFKMKRKKIVINRDSKMLVSKFEELEEFNAFKNLTYEEFNCKMKEIASENSLNEKNKIEKEILDFKELLKSKDLNFEEFKLINEYYNNMSFSAKLKIVQK